MPSSDFPKRFGGKWAVVTGASEGIGRSYALKLAEKNMNVFMISRSMTKLEKVSNEIEEKHGVQTICYPLDMSQLGGDHEVYQALESKLNDLDVGVLVNNVGIFFDRLQFFLTVPRDLHTGIVDINMSALVSMSYMVLPKMVERGKGAIINIGSGACVKATPTMSTYTASKKFVEYFSKTLNYEYGSRGIDIQCIHPFYVSTNMTHQANPNFFMVDSDAYVSSALSTLGYSSVNYGYWTHGLFGYVGELLPEWLYMFAAVHVNMSLWSWLTGVKTDKKKI